MLLLYEPLNFNACSSRVNFVEDVLSPPTKNNDKKFDDCLRNEGYLQFDGLSRVGAPVMFGGGRRVSGVVLWCLCL